MKCAILQAIKAERHTRSLFYFLVCSAERYILECSTKITDYDMYRNGAEEFGETPTLGKTGFSRVIR